MFDQFKGMAGLAGLMKDLPRIKEKMQAVQASLAEARVEAETGGGAVHVVANGQLQIISIRVDPALMSGLLVDGSSDDDRAMAEDLIAGAVNAALLRAREHAAKEASSAASELGIPLPAGAIEGLMGGMG